MTQRDQSNKTSDEVEDVFWVRLSSSLPEVAVSTTTSVDKGDHSVSKQLGCSRFLGEHGVLDRGSSKSSPRFYLVKFSDNSRKHPVLRPSAERLIGERSVVRKSASPPF